MRNARIVATSNLRSIVMHRIAMDTIITIEGVSAAAETDIEARLESAANWFNVVEGVCSRFDPESELSQLCDRPGRAIRVSPILFEALQFALAVAEASGGAFDPAIGDRMVRDGFSRDYRTGAVSHPRGPGEASYADVVLERTTNEVTLARPLTLDLGAVAKGFAADLAARELADLDGFVVDAGGDLVARGRDAEGKPWIIGIRDPLQSGSLLASVRLDGQALCTSGNYERGSGGRDHLTNPRAAQPAVLSASAIGPTAMVADALATASFVLGPTRGIAMLEEQDVDGLIVTPDLSRFETQGFARYEV